MIIWSCCRYPHCLKFLEMLQDRDFRKAIAREDVKARTMLPSNNTETSLPSVGIAALSTILFLDALSQAGVLSDTFQRGKNGNKLMVGQLLASDILRKIQSLQRRLDIFWFVQWPQTVCQFLSFR